MADIVLIESRWKNVTLMSALNNNIPHGWEEFFELAKNQLQDISRQLQDEKEPIWPSPNDVFNTFYLCHYKELKVVLVGQDPYHTPNTAFGLAFSSKPDAPIPRSLVNIAKKLRQEGFTPPSKDGYLGKWCEEGVLLINTALTVREGKAGSHSKMWEPFIDVLFKYLAARKDIIWILWGKDAQMYQGYIHPDQLIVGGHPSPMNRTGSFMDKDYFRPCNQKLFKLNRTPIDWNL